MVLIDVVFLAVLVVVVVVGWQAWLGRASRQWPAAEAAARWEDAHEAVGGRTRVVVRKVARLPSGESRVIGESVIDEIPDGAPDWHERFSAARQVAYDRAIDLNGPSLAG
ncbi:hypothetical protein SAMN05661080_03130 [Modestobacter sp. DSM 44400]|uniref:hypothetical protein n=1 Tax=Modestobacter sp. DSM 44400 TaxID=1550230 RepID=UPI00089744D3|nr:hypothetical protein [Modestobacter sp. DSM 44400]SDY33525.1 hypothetical protein SAMN05661080_03130 [Modestobacter sp. DSM 44400]